jgi:hypothetical protein
VVVAGRRASDVEVAADQQRQVRIALGVDEGGEFVGLAAMGGESDSAGGAHEAPREFRWVVDDLDRGRGPLGFQAGQHGALVGQAVEAGAGAVGQGPHV